ncbi:alpha/beta fold hydrolase [Streptomyces sp. IBSBF 2435]|uniref:alpha/beta fold hydrolase n=1 Tax=Streptomyces sp. IBSBF 2435 TaxID=2903531 RepID=UPI002FDC36A1
MTAGGTTGSPWLRALRDAGGSAPALVLFPHAGGSAGAYRALANRFPAGVEVRAVQYPGRETRAGEPLIDDMDTLADQAADALRPLLGRRLAILGHSMGAVVAYEVTRRLEAWGATPERLFVSSRQPPAFQGTGRGQRHMMDEDSFAEMLRRTGGTPAALLDDPEMRAYLLPIVRNDYRLVETYLPSPGPALRTGVVSIAAEDDGTVSAAQVEGWRQTTDGPFEHLTFPGGHFYLLDRPADLAAAVLSRLGWQQDAAGPRTAPVRNPVQAAPSAHGSRSPYESPRAGGPAPAAHGDVPVLPAAEPVAVVGMAVRLPGADTPEAFWRNLRGGVESLSTFTDEDLIASGLPPSALTDPARVRTRPVIDGPEFFDAGFFGYSPGEAAATDPQHRLFLECAWEALESAGHDPRGFADDSVSVFGGTGPDSYFLHHLHPHHAAGGPGAGSFQDLLGNSGDFLASRVSYKLDLTGPSVSVQAGCSTSLVAVHLAVQSLLAGESDVALAGGSTVYFPQRAGYVHREGGVNSPDGRCRAFDARATGTTPGDGVAVLALRRLSDALAAGDPVLGLIRGTAVNNDGAAKASFTAPAVDPQSDVAAEALAVAGLGPADIDYVEAHGTGTPVGDALEIAALTDGYSGVPAGGCRLGSAKPNVGDTWAAAGAVGLVKVLLALDHQELPPVINCTEPNPAIDFAAGPFRLNTEVTAWTRGDRPRRAAVHTFGIGGTNAHVVLEEAPRATAPAPEEEDGRWHVLPLSARGDSALRAQAARLADHLEARPGLRLDAVAHTLLTGRARFARRAAVLARGRAEALLALRALADGAAAESGPGWTLLRPAADPRTGSGAPAAPGTGPGAAGRPTGTTRAAGQADACDAAPERAVRQARQWVDGGDGEPAQAAGGPRQRVVLPTYPFERVRHWVAPPLFAGTAPTATTPPQPRPPLETPYAPPADQLEDLVAEVWGNALGIKGVGRDDNFFDLGGHSLIAAHVTTALREILPVSVGLTDLLDAPPTMAAHAERLRPRLHDALSALPAEEAAALAAQLGGTAARG